MAAMLPASCHHSTDHRSITQSIPAGRLSSSSLSCSRRVPPRFLQVVEKKKKKKIGAMMCAYYPSTKSLEQQLIRHQPETNIRIFSGGANPALSQETAGYMGLELGRVLLKTFADGDRYVRLLECVMGRDVYIVQPTCKPANDNLMELTIMIDACQRADAKSITAVIPYFEYSRADRMNRDGKTITAKLVTDQITRAGCSRVLVMDIHAGQSMGFFSTPTKQITGLRVIVDYLANKGLSSKDLVVVSPDNGGVPRARVFGEALSKNVPFVVIDKIRPDHNVLEVMNLIGDVEGKVAIMFDDIIDTAGTMAKGAALLRERGAKEVYGCAIHAVFSHPAIERLSRNRLFDKVIVTNTIPILEENYFPQLTVLSVANILAEKIWHMQDRNTPSGISFV